MPQKQQEIQIRVSDSDAKGTYSNVMMVNHSQEEFVLDFFGVFGQTGNLVSRIIMSPGHFKRVMAALADNLKKYEQQFGPIVPAEVPAQTFGFETSK
jgi:hypothetical protein